MIARFPLLAAVALLSACSSDTPEEGNDAAAAANVATPVAAPAPDPVAAAAPAGGFDVSKVPIVNPTLGAWPYFSLIDGYTGMTRENTPGDSKKDYLFDVGYDRYEFFDGTKLLPIEGRLMTIQAMGKGASIVQAERTYQKLVQDLGGVTVFEGTGADMEKLNLSFADRRHRAAYLKYDKFGVYMIRMPDREIWVEVTQPWNTDPDNYWLTVVEKKGLEVKAKVLPADQIKQALDATGRVALYVNFDTDKTSMRPESGPIVGEVVKLMTADPKLRLTVEGHTDNVGTPQKNQTLSEGRANAVVGALMTQGIAMDRLAAKGFGQTKPVADNASEDGRAKNRRVELVKR